MHSLSAFYLYDGFMSIYCIFEHMTNIFFRRRLPPTRMRPLHPIDVDWLVVVQVDGGSDKAVERRLMSSVIGWLRSVLGQRNDSGSSICLVLVITGFLLTLFDPSIAIFTTTAPTRPFVDGGPAVSCSS